MFFKHDVAYRINHFRRVRVSKKWVLEYKRINLAPIIGWQYMGDGQGEGRAIPWRTEFRGITFPSWGLFRFKDRFTYSETNAKSNFALAPWREIHRRTFDIWTKCVDRIINMPSIVLIAHSWRNTITFQLFISSRCKCRCEMCSAHHIENSRSTKKPIRDYRWKIPKHRVRG